MNKFKLYTYTQIQCLKCMKFTGFEPGNEYTEIKCPFCKEEKPKRKTNARKSKENTKEI